jgi:hypothetical protein
VLKKSYPSRYHEERPSSINQLLEKETRPEPPEKPSQGGVVLIGPDHPHHPNNIARQTSPSADETQSSKRSGPSDFAIVSHWPPDHHRRLCTICKHPCRSAIEEEFLHWASPDAIAHHYNVGWRAIYRHAHATGLFEKRGRNLRSALGHIIEHVNHVSPSADAVIRAVRAYACVTRDGKWVEPATHVIVSSGSKSPSARTIVATCARQSERPAAQPELPASAVRPSELPDNAAE